MKKETTLNEKGKESEGDKEWKKERRKERMN